MKSVKSTNKLNLFMKINILKILLLTMLFTSSTNLSITAKEKFIENLNQKRVFDIQGHRGCRGLMPENTIPAFLEAVRLGVRTLELDVVVSKDGKLLVSHDPFMSSEFCLTPDGKEILPGEDSIKYNIFNMMYEEIQKFDCGSKIHPRFPNQKKLHTYKPLLSDVIDSVEHFTKLNKLKPIIYNIETKCSPQGDGIYNPTATVFAENLFSLIEKKKILNRVIFQSFDIRTIKFIKTKNTNVKISLLVEDTISYKIHIQELGFIPTIYSPDYHFVTNELVANVHHDGALIIPWTVNDIDSMKKLYSMEVDGLITDYPDIAITNLK